MRVAHSLAEIRANRARLQFELAKTGDAVNQCPHCGSYRTDAEPPYLHGKGCPNR